MHKRLISILAAVALVGGLLAFGIAPAQANHTGDGPPPASFLPDDNGVISPSRGNVTFVARGNILSDNFDGQDNAAHLTAVAPPAIERVEWRACPLTTDPTNGISQAEVNACDLTLGVDTTPKTPGTSSTLSTPDEAYDIKFPIPSSLESFDTDPTAVFAPSNAKDVIVLGCIGAGINVEGGSANCTTDTEENIVFDDAESGDVDSTTGEMFQICTRDANGPNTTAGPATDTAGGDPCQSFPGTTTVSGAGTAQPAGRQAAVDGRYNAWEHGDPVPNEGFVIRVSTSSDLATGLAVSDFGPLGACRDLGTVGTTPGNTAEPEECDDYADGETQAAATADNDSGECQLVRVQATSALWECPFADSGTAVNTAPTVASRATDDDRSQGIMIFDDAGAAGASVVSGTGFCAGTGTAVGPTFNTAGTTGTCILDSHYSFSSARRSTTIVASWITNTDTGSPAAGSGCERGETPDKTESNPPGAPSGNQFPEVGEVCFTDQFGDPFLPAPGASLMGDIITLEQNADAPQGAEFGSCGQGPTTDVNQGTETQNGAGAPSAGMGTLGTRHDHNGDGYFEHCHVAMTGDSDGVIYFTANSRATAEVAARPGNQLITACHDPQTTNPVTTNNPQPVGHGCADTTVKDTLTKVRQALPTQLRLVYQNTGTATDPCNSGDTFKENTVGQSDTLVVCALDASGNPAGTNQTRGGRLQWTIVTAAGGQTQLATRFAASPPAETGTDGRATVQIQAVNEGTDFIRVDLIGDDGQPICGGGGFGAAFCAQAEKRVRRAGETQPPTTQAGTPGPTTTTTTTATTTASPPTPTATLNPRVVTLEASKNNITFGKSFTLSGGVTSQVPACVAGQSIVIRRTVGGQTGSVVFDTLTTNADGTFSKSYTADRNANYIAHIDANGTCGEANSTPTPVNVKVKVDLRVSSQRVRPGGRVRLTAKVAPCDNHAGTNITLFRSVGGSFGKVKKAQLNDACTARFSQRVRRSTVFQARWTKQDDDHQSGRSRKKAVRTRR